MFLLIFKNLILITIILNSTFLQSYLTKKSIEIFANVYNIELNVGNVEIELPNKIVMTNVEMKDSCKNTLLSSSELIANIRSVSIKNKEIDFSKISIVTPYINAIIDKNGIANYDYILKKFSSDNTSSYEINILCNKFIIEDGHLCYRDNRQIQTDNKFNSANIDVHNFNIELTDFKYINDTISVKLNNFKLTEKSGLDIEQFSVKVKYYNSGMSFDSLILKTQKSELLCSKINVIGKDSLYLSDPANKIEKLEVNIDTLNFCISDISPFFKQYKNIDEYIHLKGKFSGKLENFKFKDFGISMYDHTKFYANLSVNGLPDVKKTIVFGKISNLTSSKEDINKFLNIISPESDMKIPEILNEISNISFNGNISGLLSDMVAYGKFTTNIGSIKTDLAILPDFENKSVVYNGKVIAENFDLSKIIGQSEEFGKLSFTSKVSGSIDSLKNTKNAIECNISNLDFHNYAYSNISIFGIISNKKFDGDVKITDPNLNVNFKGEYEFGKSTQRININTDVFANLKNLNFTPDSTTNSELKFDINLNLSGDIKNRPIGNLKLKNLQYGINDKKIVLDTLTIEAYENLINEHSIIINSKYLDLQVHGDYKIKEVINNISNMVYKYIPAVFNEEVNKQMTCSNHFTFSFTLRNLNDIVKFINPDIIINGEISTKNGYVLCSNESFYSDIKIPEIIKGDIHISPSNIEFYALNDIANLYYNIRGLKAGKQYFENIKFAVNAGNDNVGLNINWDNHNVEKQNTGFLNINTKFSRNEETKILRIESDISPSQFIISKNIWEIDGTKISFENNEIEIDNFMISNAVQRLNIKGFVSKDENKVLNFLIENVDVSNVNIFTEKNGYKFSGLLSGSGRVANLYNIPIFTANANIKDLSINDENFGNFNLSSKWENIKKAFVFSGTNKYLEIKGLYLTKIDSLNTTISLKNLKLDIFEKYLNKYEISKLKGEVNGLLNVTGHIKKPQLNGSLNLKKTEFVYDYLKLKALTEDKVYIKNDRFSFENFKVTDEKGNIGILNGNIFHNNFKNFRFDLSMNVEKFNVMNTKLSDNNLYYGTIFASGGVTVEGTPKNYSIYAGATTEQGSKFVLPMEDYYKSKNINYITFVSQEDTTEEISSRKDLKSNSKYSFKMDVTVTPDAEVQIVFDPKAGDRIKAYGDGILKIEYTSDDDMYMYGDIEVTGGDYLFTLENIINKRFTISPGGTITWSGNPYEGKLNIDAIYSANVSLKELMSEEYDTTDTYNQKATVECHMHLNGNLMSPEIQFSINIPNANDKVKTKLASLTQDEINKQLLYVLVINQFYNPNAEIINQAGTTTNAFGVTTTEMLSNQLSNWLSQIVKDVDLGFKYTPGTEVSGREIEVALSTQIFDDRLLINGNLGIGEKKYSNENLVGDVDVQWKLNKKGTLRLKGFSRTNTDIESEYGPYTTGAGIFYTEEFDKFSEVLRKAWNIISLKKYREKRKQKE